MANLKDAFVVGQINKNVEDLKKQIVENRCQLEKLTKKLDFYQRSAGALFATQQQVQEIKEKVDVSYERKETANSYEAAQLDRINYKLDQFASLQGNINGKVHLQDYVFKKIIDFFASLEEDFRSVTGEDVIH